MVEPQAGPSSSKDSEMQHTLLWSKSKVYVHPSPYAKHNIPGYLALVRCGPARPGARILLSFLPESLVEQRQELEKFVRIEYTTSAKGPDASEERQSLDTVEVDDDTQSELIAEPPTSATYAFSLPLTSMYGFTIKTPTISSWYGTVTISQIGGVALPTLHFHDDESKSTILSMHRAKHSPTSSSASHPETDHSNGTEMTSLAPRTPSQRPPSPPPTWGGDELVHQLRKYASVHRSAIEPMLFLVNPSRADLEIHNTPVFEDDAIELPSRVGAQGVSSGWGHDLAEDPFSMSSMHHSVSGVDSPSRSNDLDMDSLTKWTKNARLSVLSRFAKITQKTRDGAQAVLSARAYAPRPVQSFAQAGPIPLGPTDGEWEWRTSSIASKSGTGEYYDSARVYLANWARLVAEEGERNRRKEERLGIGASVHGTAAQGNAAPNRTEGSELGAFEVLEQIYDLPRPTSDREARMTELTSQTDVDTSMDLTEWRSLFDARTGQPLHSRSEIRHRIFVNGLGDEARKQAWPFLLDAVPFDATDVEREAMWRDREVEYYTLKAQWQSDDELLQSEAMQEQQHRVRVDCLRTDRTQPMFERSKQALLPDADPSQDQNPHTAKLGEILLTYGVWEAEASRKVAAAAAEGSHSGKAEDDGQSLLAGYVQGMSDLCSPLYIICDGDEVKTFWCFVGLMERTKSNFFRDQSGMKFQLLLLQKLISTMDPALHRHLEKTDSLNLFFCFRWLLVRFKREFKFHDTLTLWECCWAAEPSGSADANQWGPSKSFHLFCALALLELHRDYLIRYLENFDEILQYFNTLTGEFDVNTVLNKAEVLAKTFQDLASKRTVNIAKSTSAPGTDTAASTQKQVQTLLDPFSPQELHALL